MTGNLPAIPVEKLHPNPSNVRADLGDLDELAVSIRANGLLQPLVVMQTGQGWTVIDGHRRLAAAKKAGARALPCIAMRPGDIDQQISTMLAAAMHKGLEPLEQARAFARLRARSMPIAEIARRTGYSKATVSARLLLSDLPVEVQDMVENKTVTLGEATDLARQVRAGGTGTARRRARRAAHFTNAHPLGERVAADCTHLEVRAPIGGAGCGQCWEAAIRADERTRIADMEATA